MRAPSTSPADHQGRSPHRPCYFESADDRNVLVHAVRRLRDILTDRPFADVVAPDDLPPAALPDPDDPADVVRRAREHGATGYHAVGTCALGVDDDAVLDADLRVRGTSALRVVDASAFPAITAGNNAAPTMAVAWIAADRVLADHTTQSRNAPTRPRTGPRS